MSEKELTAKIKELREMQRIAEEATAIAEGLKDQIKAYMGDSEELTAGEYKVSWRTVTSSRIDTAAMKKAVPEIVQMFTKSATSRRFTVS